MQANVTETFRTGTIPSKLSTRTVMALSRHELIVAATQMAADLQARFLKRFDSVPTGATSGDGMITAAESLAVHQEMAKDRIAAILDRFDLNDDGIVTTAEVKEVNGQRKAGPKEGRPTAGPTPPKRP
jgi:hypothetical protein